MTKELLEEITQLAAKTCSELNYSLYEVDYYKEDNQNILHVAIDNDYNTTMEDIEKFTEKFSPLLDQFDSRMEDYFLDVSSPGAFRKVEIKDLEKVKGLYLKVELNSSEVVKGEFIDLSDTSLTLKINNKGRIKNRQIEFETIKQINTDVK